MKTRIHSKKNAQRKLRDRNTAENAIRKDHDIDAILEVIDVLKNYYTKVQNDNRFNPTRLKDFDKTVAEGLSKSKQACSQSELLQPTPLMKNLLESMGDYKDDKVTIRSNNGKPNDLASVKFCEAVLNKALSFLDKEQSTKADDWQQFMNDNYHALEAWKEKFWDIKAGQAKEREETLALFENNKFIFTIEKMIFELKTNAVFRRAVKYVYSKMPAIRAARDYVDVEMDFQNKHSNTSFPYFTRDNLPKEGSNLTWGKYAVDKTRELTDNGKNPENVLVYNVFTAWPRNSLGKGRAIEASSRILNIELFRVNRVETEAVKKLKEFSALLPYDDLKRRLVEFYETCSKDGRTALNIDMSAYDTTQSPGMITLINAMRYLKAIDSQTRTLIKMRAVCQIKFLLINGPKGKVTQCYGRTPSGYIDTMLFNTYASWLLDVYTRETIDQQTLSYIWKNNMTSEQDKTLSCYLGDDILTSIPVPLSSAKQYLEQLSKLYASWGYNTNPDKTTYGTFFLQNRIFKDKKGEHRMSYPIPRVIRSALSKESAKGLGPVGWTIAIWAQLEKLRDFKPGLRIATSMLAALDVNKLLLNEPIDKIKASLVAEDQEGKQKSGKRFESTVNKIYSGNPQSVKMFSENQEKLNFDYLTELQQELRDAFDPEFYEKLGFSTPQLPKGNPNASSKEKPKVS